MLERLFRSLPVLLCAVVLVAQVSLLDLKGISTDEGFRLGIINGGHPAQAHKPVTWPTWDEVVDTVSPHAYQPGYYLFQNALMRVTGRQDLNFFRLVNVGFLALCLAGLLVLSRQWPVLPRLFLIGLFSGNAYLTMHVLQVREYIVAVALYIWGTWIVLQLDRRALHQEWADIGWFGAYGCLLSAGFFVQTWTVFPAAAQGLFLLLRRRPGFWRFASHLALSYAIAFATVWPYLRANQQKVNVGLWAQEKVTLLGQLYQGFQLVLSGHPPRHAWFTDLLPLVWLMLVVAAAFLLWRWREQFPPATSTTLRREAWLMLLCSMLPLSFQIAYFYRVEPLSVWPRYFIIHYFFLVWIIALAFRTLYEACVFPMLRKFAACLCLAAGVAVPLSSAYQYRSFQRDPYFDTGLNRESDWRTGVQLFQRILQPADILLTRDFVTRSTLSFTLPVSNRHLDLGSLSALPSSDRSRILYLEPEAFRPNRVELIEQLAAHDYQLTQIVPAAAEGSPAYWQLLVFNRP